MGVCARVEPPRDEAPGGEGVRPAGDLGHRGQARRVLPPVLAGARAQQNFWIANCFVRKFFFELCQFLCLSQILNALERLGYRVVTSSSVVTGFGKHDTRLYKYYQTNNYYP